MKRRAVALLLVLIALLLGPPAFGQEWPDPIAHHVVPAPTLGLTHGPMLGRPGATLMSVWVRTETPASFVVRYGERLPLTSSSTGVEGTTAADADSTGVVELAGLQPNTRYYYGIEIGGQLADTRVDFSDPWPSFRTLPDAASFRDDGYNPEGRFNVCFSLGVGASQDPKRSGGQYTDPPAWHTLWREHADEIQFHIMNGDYTYEEARDGTLEGVRANYKLYMDRGRAMGKLQRTVPWLFMYDDHEVEDNLFGAGQVGCTLNRTRYMHRDFQIGAWYEYAGWANPAAPQRGALRLGEADVEKGSGVLHDPNADFSALKPEQVSTILVRTGGANVGTYGLVNVLDAHRLELTPSFRGTGKVSYSIGTHHWFDWKLGNCHFFFLDTRGERSLFNAADVHDPTTFLLGERQRKWLLDGARRTDADIIFIISSVGVVVPHSAYHVNPSKGAGSKGDGFPGFVHQRELILPVLDGLDKPVVFFTGDVHNSVSARICDNVWECMVSPLNSNAHPIGTLGNMPYSGWYNAEGRRVKIKWVAGWPNNVHYSRLHGKFYAVVRVNNILKTARPEGPGYQFVAYQYPQVIVSWYDGFTGRLAYSESISALDFDKDIPGDVPGSATGRQ